MRQGSSGFADATAGGLVLLLLACLPLAAALVVFGRMALLALVPIVLLAALVAWALTPGGAARGLDTGRERRAS